jgi:hypothetical protein
LTSNSHCGRPDEHPVSVVTDRVTFSGATASEYQQPYDIVLFSV